MKHIGKYGLSLFFIILAAIGLRAVLLLTCLNSVNGDQAINGLMGMHILKGAFSVFGWEAKYGGMFTGYLNAVNFKLFGVSTGSLSLFIFPYLIISMLFSCKLAVKLYGRGAGLLTGLILAVSPVFVTIFTIDTRGGYPETLAFGPVIMYLTYIISEEEQGNHGKVWLPLLGFISGIAFWVFPLIVPYLLASWFILFVQRKKTDKKQFMLLAGFFIIGCAPLIFYNIRHPLATFLGLGGRPLDVSKASFHADLASGGIMATVLKYLYTYFHKLLFAFVNIFKNTFAIFGLANPLTEKNNLLKVLACAIYLVPACYYAVKGLKPGRTHILSALFLCTLLFTFFGCLDNPRYFLPLWTSVAIFLAAGLVELAKTSRVLAASVLIFIMGINLAGSLSCIKIKTPPYRELTDYLLSRDLHWGYANYWMAYPVTFLSKEQIIVSPTLNLKSIYPRSKDAYPFYTNRVNSEEKVFYIMNDSSGTVTLFEEKMAELKTSFKKDPFPPFMIYHSFSRRLYPEDLDLPPSVSLMTEPFFY